MGNLLLWEFAYTPIWNQVLRCRLIEEIRSVAKGMLARTWAEQDYWLDVIRTIGVSKLRWTKARVNFLKLWNNLQQTAYFCRFWSLCIIRLLIEIWGIKSVQCQCVEIVSFVSMYVPCIFIDYYLFVQTDAQRHTHTQIYINYIKTLLPISVLLHHLQGS